MFNNKISTLLERAQQSAKDQAAIRVKLQIEYSKYFDSLKPLVKELNNAECSSEYQMGPDGEIESWFRVSMLADFEECREYFETWISDRHFRIDWDNDCFLYSQGECIVIQDDTRRDNGVWLNGKVIVAESYYRDEDTREVNEAERNRLIEAYMEREGYYPGVFRVTQYGDVFPVDTKAVS